MFKTVYVVIDALHLCDEYCDGGTTQTILETFSELPENVRLLFTCNNSPQAKGFGAQQKIQVKPNPADVEAYVHSCENASRSFGSMPFSGQFQKHA
ncbi:uncharacterized protein FFB20_09299 [Fusarium fujikuroi]|nr:uncharacterized protein FFC1_03737 [Fusarium fujikuroi]SCN92845.1 uncharacterized protein FFB20_09299 [Fusarium fujikuroi]SCO08454.1 uncharacterized protein FFM5_09358 [Fusarium fujikuroi]SCO32969.1 uncharacterized protein FFNC_03191 [Fusarium fujikuroi]